MDFIKKCWMILNLKVWLHTYRTVAFCRWRVETACAIWLWVRVPREDCGAPRRLEMAEGDSFSSCSGAGLRVALGELQGVGDPDLDGPLLELTEPSNSLYSETKKLHLFVNFLNNKRLNFFWNIISKQVVYLESIFTKQ